VPDEIEPSAVIKLTTTSGTVIEIAPMDLLAVLIAGILGARALARRTDPPADGPA
jgi:hypothetical protein